MRRSPDSSRHPMPKHEHVPVKRGDHWYCADRSCGFRLEQCDECHRWLLQFAMTPYNGGYLCSACAPKVPHLHQIAFISGDIRCEVCEAPMDWCTRCGQPRLSTSLVKRGSDMLCAACATGQPEPQMGGPVNAAPSP